MNYIGIDLGGTNVRVALVNEDGNVLQVVKQATEIEHGTAHVMSKIKSMIREIKGYESIKGIGLGVPGPVDTKNRCLLLSSNLPGFTNYPIAQEIEEEFNVPTFIDNDANVAGLGEATQGAGKGFDSTYYVTISTGIGGAFVNEGKVVAGKYGHAGEIGNLIIDRNRETLNHMNTGAIENEASGTALVRKGVAHFGDEVKHAGHVFDKARENNPEAIQIIKEMQYDLAVMFSMIAHVVDPAVFVIGGGVTEKEKDSFLNQMIEHFMTLVHPGMKGVQFKTAELEEPGIVGAAMLPIANLK